MSDFHDGSPRQKFRAYAGIGYMGLVDVVI